MYLNLGTCLNQPLFAFPWMLVGCLFNIYATVYSLTCAFLDISFSGYYCSGASEKPNPVGESYGSVCTAGNYCPNGTAIPIACPSGTFLNITTMEAESDCIPCSPGMLLITLTHLLYSP